MRLLDRWGLCSGDVPVAVPYRAQRLIAFLAVFGVRPRAIVAASLWPDSTDEHARSNLRTTAVQVRRMAPFLLDSARDPLGLGAAVLVDLDLLRTAIDGTAEQSPECAAQSLLAAGELLPGWYEDWVLFERDRLRQSRLSALHRVSRRLLRQGDLTLALTCAQTCVALEPLWESPHRTLVQIHLAAGNRVNALRVYEDFRERSITEFGLAPDPAFDALVGPLVKEREVRRYAE